MKHKRQLLAGGVFLVLLSGCQTVQDVKEKLPSLSLTGPSVEKVGDLPKVETPKWDDATEDVNDNRAVGYGLVNMPGMETYLNQLYVKIKKTAEVPDWPGKIYISSDSTLNAHSSGAGNIFVNIAVLQSFESEDEIFALLSHEFAHVYLGHQTAYNARMLTDTATLLAMAAKTAGKDVNLNVWGSQNNIALLGMAANSVLLPAWQRSVEEQADRLGATISLRNGYSYASGFKAFLERLADVEQDVAKKSQAQLQIKRSAAIQGRKTDVDKAIGEVGDSINDKIAALVGSATQNHDDAVFREDALSQQVAPLLPRPRPQPRVIPWRNALKEKTTAEVLAHYALFPRIDQMTATNKYRDALRLARTAASGATAGDGMAVSYLSDVMQKNGISRAEQMKVLMRNQDWPQRSWAVQVSIANAIAATDKAKGKAFIDQQYAYFGQAQRAMPDVISFYVAQDDKGTAERMALACTVSNPRFRAICLDRSKTEAQRQTEKMQSEARAKTMANQIGDKMKVK
ncbi:M48 family metalloprotease [Herbaspirillum rhizosphaerae]|uniref:M48 family metalloprotease n=1 Tax=Herbaspirillum rhizosphaerae TaxID=346179 RepID=A0ABW8ZA48_9BURK